MLYAEGEDEGERPRPARKILVHVGTVLARAHPQRCSAISQLAPVHTNTGVWCEEASTRTQ